MIISVPNVAHIDVRLMLLEGRWDYQQTGLMDDTHLRWFTKTSLRELLNHAGLVAIRLERVRIGRFGSDIVFDHERSRSDAIAFIEADPEAYTFQYVVEAIRTDEAAGLTDALDDADVDWPSLDHADAAAALDAEVAALRERVGGLEQERAALRANVDAWENSTLVRVARPARAAWARLRRIIRS